jgi:hypothetical protein
MISAGSLCHRAFLLGVDFHSPGAFRFELVSIKALPAGRTDQDLPLSRVSSPHRSDP